MLTACLSFASQKATKSISEELSGAARSAFEQGKTLFEHGDYVTAHAKFKAAYEEDPARFETGLPGVSRTWGPEKVVGLFAMVSEEKTHADIAEALGYEMAR